MIKTIHGWGKEEQEYVVYEELQLNGSTSHHVYVHENEPFYDNIDQFDKTFANQTLAYDYMAILHNNFPDLATIEILTEELY